MPIVRIDSYEKTTSAATNVNRTPVGRLGTRDEVAGMIFWTAKRVSVTTK